MADDREFEDILADAKADVASLSGQLEALIAAGAKDGPSKLTLARRIYQQRRLRDHFFPAGLFAEPAWDILLALYIARLEDQEVSTSSACHAAAVPATTGLRWLNRLCCDGLVVRKGVPRDDRLTLVEIGDEAFASMSGFLMRLGAREG